MKPGSEIRQLLLLVDQGYNRTSWHGTNLRGSIRRITADQAAWRPAPGRHNIWEIVIHAAYWKYAVRRRLLGEQRGSFPLKGSNWFERPEVCSEAAWRTDIALLDRMHESLREAIGSLSARDLQRTRGAGRTNNFALISGIAAHDLYHAGQIQLLKRLR
jgi:hypothetical protein